MFRLLTTVLISVAVSATTQGAPADTTPPTVSSMLAQLPTVNDGATAFTTVSNVTWRVVFNEPVDPSTVQLEDFTLRAVSGASTLGAATLTGVSQLDATTFDVSAFTDPSADLKVLSLVLFPAATITDLAGNDYSTTVEGTYLWIELTPPTSNVYTHYISSAEPEMTVMASAADVANATGVSSVSLFVRLPSSDSFTDTGLTPTTSNSTYYFNYLFTESGQYEFYSLATDHAGNVELPPSEPDRILFYNGTPAAPFTFRARAGGSFIGVMPLGASGEVFMEIPEVTASGSLTLQWFKTDAAPPGYNPGRLADQWLRVTQGPGFGFNGPVTVGMVVDTTLLGGLTGAEITTIFRDTGAGVQEITPQFVDPSGEFLVFETAGFSDFYFGNNNADLSDWPLIED